jgi:undecaprenyl-diphosphatase
LFSQWLQSAAEFLMVYGSLGLFLVSFAESSFFPLPPDILLIGLSLGEPKLALWYALLTTVASVLGGIFGYFIGIKAGRPLLQKWIAPERIRKMEELFRNYGGWAVAIAGFTPIPYKVFTIGAGIFRINKIVFVVASLLSRGARFFLEGLLLFSMGVKAKEFLSSYLEIITVVVALVVIMLYLIFRSTKIIIGFRKLWIKSRTKLEDLYTKKISPLGAFGNYLIGGLVLGLVFILLFAKLAEDLINNELKLFDQIVIDVINLINSPLTTLIMKVITSMGSPATMIFLALVVLVYLRKVKKHFWDSNMVITALAGSWIMNEILKWAFHRSRPDIARLVKVTGYSFPSGHAMISFAFYGMLAYLMWINLKTKKLKYFFTSLFLFLVFAIGISRIYLGVHYPSDVLAGFAAGGFWLVGCILGLQAIRYYKSNV